MKESMITEAVDRAVSLEKKAIDLVLEELVAPIMALGNPEELVGRPYDEWKDDPTVMGTLTAIYGTQSSLAE